MRIPRLGDAIHFIYRNDDQNTMYIKVDIIKQFTLKEYIIQNQYGNLILMNYNVPDLTSQIGHIKEIVIAHSL